MLFLLRNTTGVDLILPRISLDCPPRYIIPPNGLFTMDKDSADLLQPFAAIVQWIEEESDAKATESEALESDAVDYETVEPKAIDSEGHDSEVADSNGDQDELNAFAEGEPCPLDTIENDKNLDIGNETIPSVEQVNSRGIIENTSDIESAANTETNVESLIANWWRIFESRPVRAGQMISELPAELVRSLLPDSHSPQARTIAMGHLLLRLVGQDLGGRRVESRRSGHGFRFSLAPAN